AEHHQLLGRTIRPADLHLATGRAQGDLLGSPGKHRAATSGLSDLAAGSGPSARIQPEILTIAYLARVSVRVGLAQLFAGRIPMPTATMDPVIVRLEKAPRLEWAKHRSRARRDLRCLLHSWLLTGKWYYSFLLLSETGRLLAREKYSAFAIDRVYANDPAGFGWLGRRLDRYLLDLPVHRAVRDRFAFVTRNLAMAIESQLD